MALRSPAVRVLAITTVAGNVAVQQATRNALYTAELCGADVPVLWAGFACGILDITAALIVYGYLGLKPMRLLQGIASGLLGPKAFDGGLATAFLGLLCHFFIAFGAATVYFVASRAIRPLQLRSTLSRAALFVLCYNMRLLLAFSMAWPSIS